MSFINRLFGRKESHPRERLRPLYNQIVAKAREPHWYTQGGVPDSVDGRFDMIAAILAVTLLRLEQNKTFAASSAFLTEIFVNDMDGQLREIGIGDMVVGKHIGRMMASLGGRLTALRSAFTNREEMGGVIVRNLYRGAEIDLDKRTHVCESLLEYNASLAKMRPEDIVSGGF